MPFTIDYELLITYAVLITGFVSLLDVAYFARRRVAGSKAAPILEYSRSFFPILLVVLLIRSFLYEPFRIPSGSLKPTLQVGDFIIVNKFDYGLRLPILHTKILPLGEPKTGDIMVFHFPENPNLYLIKRVIGIPGDHIRYQDKVLYINGEKMSQTLVGSAMDNNGDKNLSWPAIELTENLHGIIHKIYQRPDVAAQDIAEFVVPADHYFVMGDNRDNSNDSRYWGFVPEENITGKAIRIWLSWDGSHTNIRWDRFGSRIN